MDEKELEQLRMLDILYGQLYERIKQSAFCNKFIWATKEQRIFQIERMLKALECLGGVRPDIPIEIKNFFPLEPGKKSC